MDLNLLSKDVIGRLPEDRIQILDSLVREFGADENLHFLLALVAATGKRDRQLLRLLIKELDLLERDSRSPFEGV